ncbi:MAG: alpha/beta fold hydrolase [Acidimicrobiales bacterium]
MTSLTTQSASDLFRRSPDRLIATGPGTEVAYRQVGTGPDVLFVHGWPASGATYRGLLPYLADHVTCHLLDLPGAGASRFGETSDLSIPGHAAAIRTVMDELGLRDVAVVGHNSGGMFARFALAGDTRVRAWGLVDTEQPPKAHWRFAAFLKIKYVPRFEHVLGWAVNQRLLRRNEFVLGSCFQDSSLLDGEFEEFFLRPLADDPHRRLGAGMFARNFDLDLFGELAELHAKIEAPVHLVWGDDDPFFPLDRTEEMMSGFGGPVDLTVIEGGRLFHHEEFPEQVAAALLPTLTGG